MLLQNTWQRKVKELRFRWLRVSEAPLHLSEWGTARVVALHTVGSGGSRELVAEIDGRVRGLAETSKSFKIYAYLPVSSSHVFLLTVSTTPTTLTVARQQLFYIIDPWLAFQIPTSASLRCHCWIIWNPALNFLRSHYIVFCWCILEL